jgi:hypothetical protein
MSADEIPMRPGTGMGAPAVPSNTNSVVMPALLLQSHLLARPEVISDK